MAKELIRRIGSISVTVLVVLHGNLCACAPQGAQENAFRNGFSTAEIKPYKGAPTLFLDGKPAFYGTWWSSPPTIEGWSAA